MNFEYEFNSYVDRNFLIFEKYIESHFTTL